MGKPTGAGGKQFGQFVTFHLFESFAMNITLNCLMAFKVHSSRVPGVKMAGSKALLMMEKNGPQKPDKIMSSWAECIVWNELAFS